MSKHYLVMRQQVFGASVTAAETIIKKLEATDPESAKQLRKVDWKKLRRKLMQQAIKEVAKESGATLRDSYDNSYGSYGKESGQPPQGGQVIGVLKDGNTQLGFAVKNDGSFHTFENDVSRGSTTQWKKAVERRYRELSVKAVLAVLKCDTKEAKRGNTTIIVGRLPKKGKVR